MAGKSKNKKKPVIHNPRPLKSNFQKEAFHIPAWAIYAVLVITALVYIRALFNGFASLDDDIYVFENPYIKYLSFDTVKSVFTSFYFGIYHPLTTLSYMLEYHFFGLNPFPFHLFNIILHLINVYLVYILTGKLSGQRFTSVFVAAMFALHPMHVESVAWVSERKDVLYSLFYLLSLISYLRYIDSGYNKKHYVFTLLLFIASLLSKPSAITLFMLLLAVDIYRGRKISIGIFIEKLPFFALSVLLAAVTYLQPKADDGTALLYAYTFVERIFLFTYSLAFYIVKLVVPFHLSAIHYHPETGGVAFPWYYYASLPFLMLLAWLVVRKTRLRRDKLFGITFFLVAISIMLPVLPIGLAITSERYTYIAYIGLFFVAGQGIVAIKNTMVRKAALILCALILAAFSYLSWDRIKVWESGITLFTDVIKKYPEHPDGYIKRAIIKKNQENYQSSLEDCNKALAINPNFTPGLSARGSTYIEMKNYEAALTDLDLAVKLGSSEADTYNNRGFAFQNVNDTVAAMRDYNKALKINPMKQVVYNNRSTLKAIMGNFPGALEDINKAISLNPDDSKAYCNRGNIKYFLNDFSGAVNDYSIAVKLKPKDNQVLFNCGMARLNLNDTSGACEDWQKSLNLGNQAAGNMINQYCK
ncbi:MAG TPA: hypothetical protein PKW80_07740 [Bacteroidales bacterium]|nr:hypothetical protein [Bacteroidales bacterium]